MGLDFGNGVFFRGVTAPGLVSPSARTRFTAISDGLSNTFFVGEAVPQFCTHTWWWASDGAVATASIPPNVRAQCTNTGNRNPDLVSCQTDWVNNMSFMSQHVGGINFVFGDGRVSFISDNIELATYRAMAAISDGLITTIEE